MKWEVKLWGGFISAFIWLELTSFSKWFKNGKSDNSSLRCIIGLLGTNQTSDFC